MTTDDLIRALRSINGMPEGPISLHAPVFGGNERACVADAIDSTFVSSVGAHVVRFEVMLRDATGARRAVACVNGTAALEMALRLVGVAGGDLVITQALSFVATANAVVHCGATPVFCDVDPDDAGLSPESLRSWLEGNCASGQDGPQMRMDGRRVAACAPMHAFGLPCRIGEILDICAQRVLPKQCENVA